MLTSDLLRVRVDGNTISPRYITRREGGRYLEACQQLIEIYQEHVGRTRGELERALERYESDCTNYKVYRGLAKLLEERATFQPAAQRDYTQLRRQVFSMAQRFYPIITKSDLLHQENRRLALVEIAREIGVPPEEIDGSLYGDLPENQILIEMEPVEPEGLLRRYNLALAQALLYHASRMTIQLFGDYKVVFKYIKLSRLIHYIERSERAGYQVTLDGPASLFRHTQKYGVRMAMFLPGLLLARRWRMTAQIHTQQGEKIFSLNENCGLTSHYHREQPFDSRVEETFYRKFQRTPRGWLIEREAELIDLGDTVFIPDFVFRRPDGRQAALEIIGFWTPEYLTRKMEKIKRAGRSDIILAVNAALNCAKEDFAGEVIFYKSGIVLSEVLERLEKVGSTS